MKSEWRVTTNYINGKNIYRVYRLIDTREVDHSGNREFYGNTFDNEEEAESLARAKNI